MREGEGGRGERVGGPASIRLMLLGCSCDEHVFVYQSLYAPSSAPLDSPLYTRGSGERETPTAALIASIDCRSSHKQRAREGEEREWMGEGASRLASDYG